jgi:hypothetical protein
MIIDRLVSEGYDFQKLKKPVSVINPSGAVGAVSKVKIRVLLFAPSKITICTIFKMTYFKLSSLFKLKRYLMNTEQIRLH